MDPYFLADLSNGNLGFVMPWWAWLIVILMITICCFEWGRERAIKNYAKYFNKKHFGKYLGSGNDSAARERRALKTLGQGYIVIEQLDDPNKATNDRKIPLALWEIRDTRRSDWYIIATPIPGYVPNEGDAVHLMSWATGQFDRKSPALIYFIGPASAKPTLC